MARDSKDKSTLPLIPEPKKPGRPSTGTALTPAQRKAQQRQRDREKVVSDNLSDATITALCESLQKSVSTGDVDLVKGITLELMKRAKVAQKTVTVTKTKSLPGNKTKAVTVTKNALPSPELIRKKTQAYLKDIESRSNTKSVTVTKKKPISTNAAIAKREAEIKKMINHVKPKQPSLI